MRPVKELKPGDRVDLEGDPYADRKHNHPEYEFEFAVVVEVTQETPNCIVVEFDMGTVAFPPTHLVEVD